MSQEPGRVPRLRGREITRLEALSDAVFGFAATLLVVSLEVPRSFPELTASLQGFAAFAFSFTMLILIWAAHNGFFRRYALQDTWTIVLNSVLLFVVLFYVYPLKFLFTALTGRFFGLGSDEGMLRSEQEMATLMIVYGVGFVAVFTCFALLYRRASALRKELELDEIEQLEAHFWFRHYLVFVGVGALSIALVLIGVPLFVTGMIYGLIGPLCHWNGTIARRRTKQIEQRLATEPT